MYEGIAFFVVIIIFCFVQSKEIKCYFNYFFVPLLLYGFAAFFFFALDCQRFHPLLPVPCPTPFFRFCLRFTHIITPLYKNLI